MDVSSAEFTSVDHVPHDAGIDLELALQRLGNDSELLRELALICVQDAPGLLDEAVKGIDPVQREEAARGAHSLKGLTANFSAATAETAQMAEAAIRSGDKDRIVHSLETLRTFVTRLVGELQRSVLN
jgi:HPt (histidine-containing phosphotransfer) domain-containing protein